MGRMPTPMIVAVPREAAPKERRVALVPETVSKLTKSGVTVRVRAAPASLPPFPTTSMKPRVPHWSTTPARSSPMPIWS